MATAAITAGLLDDLLKAGHLNENKKHFIYDSKVFRAKVQAEVFERFLLFLEKSRSLSITSKISGILLDSRKERILLQKM